MNNSEKENWDLIIKPKNKWYQIDLAAIWRYRDLLMLLVKRDFISVYKQTILGPVWFFVQPLLTTLTFTVIFGQLANISTDGIPQILFYLAGITLWTYFADCLNNTSNTFIANAAIFGKVFFPRLVVPVSVLISNLIKLGIQFLLFIIVWVYFVFFTQNNVKPQLQYVWLFPLLILLMAGLGFGFGILVSSLTTKYRDLRFLVTFSVQLMMYASPIVYPLSITSGKLKTYLLLNPVTSVIEAFKFIFLGNGYLSFYALGYSALFMLVITGVGIVIFNKTEKSFMDTV